MAPPGSSEGTSTLIGVGTAVAANTLIALALNLQRLAHLKRQRKPEAVPTSARAPSPARGRVPALLANERTPLIITTKPTLDRSLSDPEPGAQNPVILVPSLARTDSPPPLARVRSSSRSTVGSRRPRTDKGFLRSPLWLLGFACQTMGEFGNFLAFGFAPPSVVAPLGMVSLIANVFLAPLIVREPFRRKDLLGVAIAVIGGATVVYASRSNDKKLTPDEFVKAVSRPLFIAYAVFSMCSMSALGYLSQTKLGDRYILIDLSLCALAGAFTVLSTKAISSFLNLLFLRMFSFWITYPVLVVLVATGLMQVNFVNKSLQRFESRVVVPVQYMTFALSTIVGSGILYRDFEGIALPSLVNFVFGCVISGLGVYLLARDPPSSSAAATPTPSTRTAPLTPFSPHVGPHPSLSHHVIKPAGASGAGSGRTRKLSLTLGGGYLLAGSPGGQVGLPLDAGEEEAEGGAEERDEEERAE
ncbi:hypothetical protein JCM3770_005980 [Rhodotorula araucariae]